ncbi:Aste57867_7550 [Aphanomyces stellatus]|uniref:Aste57867_7550 protein n=1 Tax=Aphanomyces stellatus TaxID=120398 RepID=A0A485KIJ8_9STRA|nr:hypothetical protein As57867_007524 [Aphanomyces stellatus]VFT84459.1 Aste57867_7550 [Aphanomyces stellatus]
MADTCIFNGCPHQPMVDSVKCAFHRTRDKCSEPECSNQVYARGRCVRHGGKKACAKPGCRGNVRIGDFCARHAVGGAKRQCRVAGCGRIGRVKGICVAHGGGRLCAQEQCASFARVGGYCQRHRHLKQSSTNSTLMAVDVVDEGDYDVNVIDTVLRMSAVDLTPGELGGSTSPLDQEMVCFYF